MRDLAILAVAWLAGCAPDLASRLDDETDLYRVIQPRRSGSAEHVRCPWGADLDAHGALLGLCPDTARVADLVVLLPLATSEEARTDLRPSGQRSLAVFDVLTSAASDLAIDRGIRRLNLGLQTDSLNPDLLNDLAALHLARAGQSGDLWTAAEALSLVDRVLESHPNHAPAAFNKALALGLLELTQEALEAWHHAAEVTRDPDWRNEVLGRAAMLEEASASAGTSVASVDDMIPRLIALGVPSPVPDDDGRSWTELLEQASLLAEGGEATPLELISLLRQPTSEATGPLSDALHHYTQALELWEGGEYSASGAAYLRAERAATRLGQQGEALARRASIGFARSLVYDGQLGLARDRFHRVLTEGADRGEAEGVAHAHWGMAVALVRDREWVLAEEHLAAARDRFENLGQTSAVASVRFLSAEVLALTGSETRALRDFIGAAGLFRGDGEAMHHNLLSVTGRFVASRYPRAGGYFHREGLRIARRISNPQFEVEALIRLAQAEARVGRAFLAADYLEEAERGLEKVVDRQMRRRVTAEYHELIGMHMPGLSGPSRDSLLSEAITYFREAVPGKVPYLLEARGRHRLENGQVEDARSDLLEALAVVEQQLEDLPDPARRAELVQAREDATDALARVLLLAADTVGALRAIDLGRAASSERSRGNWHEGTQGEPWTRLPHGTGIVAYGIVGPRSYAWVVRQDGVKLVSLELQAHEISYLVERIRYMLQAGSGLNQVGEVSARLHAHLIEPLLPSLEGIGTLVVVPDGDLHALPFSILGERPGEILRRFTITHSPAIAFSLASVRPLSPEEGTALLVSATAWDADRHPHLLPLPFADIEVEALSTLYPAATVFGEEKGDLERALSASRIFHFSGHAIVRDDRPDLSELVLDVGQTLTASRIATLDLSRMELAVLSACETQRASGGSGGGGGLSGLTWSFLEAGARGVIGSLWAVADSSTSAFMVDLHGHVAGGRAPAEALRESQIQHLEASEEGGPVDWSWSAFRFEGVPH